MELILEAWEMSWKIRKVLARKGTSRLQKGSVSTISDFNNVLDNQVTVSLPKQSKRVVGN